jgi:hypothetical protein
MPNLSTCFTRVRIVHSAYTRHTRARSSNTTTQLGAFPFNLFLFCALLTSTTCLHIQYTGAKHVYNAVKGHVAYIAHRRVPVLFTALKHIMSASMLLCKRIHLYSQFPKKFVPYRCLHLVSLKKGFMYQ